MVVLACATAKSYSSGLSPFLAAQNIMSRFIMLSMIVLWPPNMPTLRGHDSIVPTRGLNRVAIVSAEASIASL